MGETLMYAENQSLQQRSDLITVNLIRKPQGFGFRLLGGLEVRGEGKDWRQEGWDCG